MRIREIRVGRLALPLKRSFKTALRTVTALESVLVRVVTDAGAAGYGEAPPTAAITGETAGSICAAIGGVIAPALLGMDIEDMDGMQARLHRCMVGNTSAKAAVDMALYDLFAKRWGAPLWKLLGGHRPTVLTDVTISVGPIGEMVADSLAAIAQGYSILKLKVGTEGDDVARVRAVRNAVGAGITLRVDANQAWSAKESVARICEMEDAGLNIELVEQPVRARDFAALRYVTRRVGTLILADEAVFSPADAMEILRTGAADLINIKLMKAGGIGQAIKLCAIAEEFGAECMMGCMLESRLAVSAAAHLAAGRGIITRTDLDGAALCAADPFVGGPDFIGQTIVLGDAPGIGITHIPCDNWH